MSGYGFKSRLKEALSSAVGYFQDGGDPNAACVKAANEAGFNADQADRLVETFNTARVICHYKVAEDKTSDCSLADKEIVRGQLTLPQLEEKSAGFSEFDYGCYRMPEVDHVVRQAKEAEFEVHDEGLSKAAEDWLRIRKVTALKELAKEAAEQARGLRSMSDEIAERVAAHMSRNATLSDVHDRMARLVRAYALDERYAPGVEKVAEFLPQASDPEDISHLLKYAKVHVVDTSDLADILPRVKEASDFVAEAAALEAYAAETEKDAQEMEQEAAADPTAELPDDRETLENMLLKERIIGERSRNARSADTGRAVTSEPAPVRVNPAKPSGGGGGNLSGNGLVAYLVNGWKSRVDAAREARIGKATDAVANVRRQIILQDLMTRDKILSQEDPNAVLTAFRSIHQISPDSTLNREVLRSMLRSVVQSVAISPFDAKTLADLDKSRRQAYEPKTEGGKKND